MTTLAIIDKILQFESFPIDLNTGRTYINNLKSRFDIPWLYFTSFKKKLKCLIKISELLVSRFVHRDIIWVLFNNFTHGFNIYCWESMHMFVYFKSLSVKMFSTVNNPQ